MKVCVCVCVCARAGVRETSQGGMEVSMQTVEMLSSSRAASHTSVCIQTDQINSCGGDAFLLPRRLPEGDDTASVEAPVEAWLKSAASVKWRLQLRLRLARLRRRIGKVEAQVEARIRSRAHGETEMRLQ